MLRRVRVRRRGVRAVDAGDEPVAADVVAGLALDLLEPLLDHRLRGDAGVVGAGDPAGGLPLEARQESPATPWC